MITVQFGADTTLPCVTNIASPVNYTWEQLSTQSVISRDTTNNTFSNGSLLVTNVKNADSYKCTATGDSAQGMTIQFVEIVIGESLCFILYIDTHSKALMQNSTQYTMWKAFLTKPEIYLTCLTRRL